MEIYFSVVQRKVVSPNDFTDLTEVRDRLQAFEDRYNAAAQPFQWQFTTSDLDDLLARLDRHTADHHRASYMINPRRTSERDHLVTERAGEGASAAMDTSVMDGVSAISADRLSTRPRGKDPAPGLALLGMPGVQSGAVRAIYPV
ncbi:hypothetical protein [Streptomyces sp. NPDC048665]|uniref:hypothetical protein n=1 Tax=Streptomyces sp. NPDC048665 TaxID=3155490 RepID=UPI00343939BF